MHKPILVLQMQRMGDLILSFPLLALLQNIYPHNPLWTVAEECFFSKLMHVAPKTVFFPPTALEQLRTQPYEAVINLSHRLDAAFLAGSLEAEQRFGAYSHQGTTFMHGDWLLYRASLVQNNRYNLFHWSDLFLLDHLQGKSVPPCSISWSAAHNDTTQAQDTIGIFVGASEEEKRPDAAFFAHLAKALQRKGYKTLFLGGPSDVATGDEAERLCGLKGSSLCGKFSIDQLALVLQKLALFITPDTGPMHLAAWVNTPILNLSVGPVHPWETGPRSAQNPRGNLQHHIVQPALSCNGCWKACTTPSRCQKKLHPQRIALLAHSLIQHKSAAGIELPGLDVYRVGHTAQGLYELTPYASTQSTPSTRLLLGKFWRQWFLARLQQHQPLPVEEFALLCQHYPHIGQKLRKSVGYLGQKLRLQLKNRLLHRQDNLHGDFWHEVPKVIRPFSSYTQFRLQNQLYSLQAWEQSLQDIEVLYSTVS